jgi:lysophospholipase L1-like esterase
MILRAAAVHPQIVVVNGGRNEIDRANDPGWERGVHTFYTALRATVPDATIIATSPIWDDDPLPNRMRRQREIVQREVEAIGGLYVDLGDPLTGHPELVDGDSVHPNDLGHAAIADALVAGVRSAQLAGIS